MQRGLAMEEAGAPDRQSRDRKRKDPGLRGDVIRRAARENESVQCRPFSEFRDLMCRAAGAGGEPAGRGLANADQAYLAYAQLTGAGYDVDEIVAKDGLQACYLVAKQGRAVRVVVPVSTACRTLSPALLDKLLRDAPRGEVGEDGEDMMGSFTIAFVDSDSVCFLPFVNTIAPPAFDKESYFKA